MENLNIRNARQSDLPIILKLFAEAYQEYYISQGEIELGMARDKTSLNPDGIAIKKNELETLLDLPGCFLRVAYNSDHIVGIAVSYVDSSYPWSIKYGEIADIVVDSNFRRRGIGRKLVEDAEHLLRTHSAKNIFIEVNDENIVGQSFFSKLGYKTTSKNAWKQLENFKEYTIIENKIEE